MAKISAPILMWTCTLWCFLCWRPMKASDSGRNVGRNVKECIWHVSYSLEPIVHERGFQLYFKTSPDSCQSKSVYLQLFKTRWSNVTQCTNKNDLAGVHHNETEDRNFWYTNLDPGDYCIEIKPFARTCLLCPSSFTSVTTLFPSPYEALNWTIPRALHSAPESSNATTSLYIAGSVVLLISIAILVLLVYKRTARFSAQEQKSRGSGVNELRVCTCDSSRKVLRKREVFIIHASDATNISNILCRTIRDLRVLSASTLLQEINVANVNQGWLVERMDRTKIIVVESEGAVRLRRNQMETSPMQNAHEETCLMQNEQEVSNLDMNFLYALNSITTDSVKCFLGYDRVFVVRFPSISRDMKIDILLKGYRCTLPEDFPELCKRLLEVHCQKCLVQKKQEWMRLSDEFRRLISRETSPQLHT